MNRRDELDGERAANKFQIGPAPAKYASQISVENHI
jgi:hypothetical protein